MACLIVRKRLTSVKPIDAPVNTQQESGQPLIIPCSWLVLGRLDAWSGVFLVVSRGSRMWPFSSSNAVIDAINKSQAVIEFEPDGTILWANANFLKTMGYRLDDIRGKHHRLFCDPEEVQSDAYRDFWARLNRGEFSTGLFRRLTKQGRGVWLQATYNPLYDAQGRLQRIDNGVDFYTTFEHSAVGIVMQQYNAAGDALPAGRRQFIVVNGRIVSAKENTSNNCLFSAALINMINNAN